MASAKQKRKKFIRGISGRIRIVDAGKKTKKRTCNLCGKMLHGVPHGKTTAQLSRLSKSEKKPNAIFAGLLCSKCRRKAIDNAIMLNQSTKSIQNIDLELQKFAKQAAEKIK